MAQAKKTAVVKAVKTPTVRPVKEPKVRKMGPKQEFVALSNGTLCHPRKATRMQRRLNEGITGSIFSISPNVATGCRLYKVPLPSRKTVLKTIGVLYAHRIARLMEQVDGVNSQTAPLLARRIETDQLETTLNDLKNRAIGAGLKVNVYGDLVAQG